MSTRRHFITGAAALPLGGVLALPSLAWGQGLELGRIVSGFPPGGTVDVLARRVADKLRGSYATNMVVENKPGAAGQIGVITVKDANPDGSTLLLTPSSMLSIYPYTYPKLQYKLEDVAPVSVGAYINHGLAVGPAVPASVKTLKDFLAWTRANPDKASYGSPGAGSMPHMIGVLIDKFGGAGWRHIPYRGTVPGVQDLLGGQISAFCGPIGDYLPHLKTGKLRVLAISGKSRSPFLPDVPTLRELGMPLAVREWYGFFLPGKASATTVRRAAAYLQPALAQPDLVDYGRQFGLDIQSSSAPALGELLQADAEEWRRLIKQIGFTAES
ncbi:tripartite tricarboxylate transporter substrate-binding protein [Rhodoferax ferrireducens]|uniref:tripartite tricarboxylate transporter substrate-binding protein n=1 Tax=Rhodoferax ferrireducens TaxID=192843 RepID=UPI000E0E0599|nr:tripartite tricarboxylate transporter substrate-binding protein [Rhodoferax ferrireducens]